MKNETTYRIQQEDKELYKSAPILSKIKEDLDNGVTENPFSVPTGYFDALNAEVMKKIESIPDFESVSSENPFRVPAGYFDTLPMVVQQRIIDEKSKRSSLAERISEIFTLPVPKYALAFASLALILFLSIKYFNRTVKVDYVEQQIPESEQLDAFYLQQVDESTLAEVYAEETPAITDTQEQGIENYLLDNDIDLNSITEKL